MIAKIRRGEPIAIEEFIEFSEDPQFSFEANEAKKEFKRGLPKVYRNGTGKRTIYISKNKNDLVKNEYLTETEIQADYEIEENEHLSNT